MAENDFNDVRTGKKFGYGGWLQPIIQANDEPTMQSTSPQQGAEVASRPETSRGGRGRPRVARPRNDSAVEKRRAQVREAQRTYQRRKDTATATESRRADELLQLLLDLSTDVESLLQAASIAGNMHRDDEVSENAQRLWSTYDSVISSEHVQPELRLLQLKNTKRLVAHQAKEKSRIDTALEHAEPRLDGSCTSTGQNDHNFELGRIEGTTVISSFQRTAATEQHIAGRSIIVIVKERQAALKETDQRQAGC